MDANEWEGRGKAAFRDRVDGSPEAVAVAPGRVNLVGGHTDYNNGYVLPVAIDRHTVVAGRRRDDQTVVVHSETLDTSARFDLSTVEPGDASWVEYVAGVIDALAVESDLSGMELVVTSDVPLGAGLSSSAALELAVSGLARELFDLQMDDYTLAVECWRAENEFVGVSCGIMDQYTAAFGDADHALFLDCRERIHDPVRLPDEVRLVAIDTNVSHDLAASAYNDRVAKCREGVDAFDDTLPREITSLRDISLEEFKTHAEALGQPVRDRCEHVVTENERVREAATALENGDLARCGELMFASHDSLRTRYEVSCRELDLVVQLARETEGVHGTRMTGGGFGGSAIAIVRPDAVDRFTVTIRETYPSKTGVDPDIHVCQPSDGVRSSTL